jgi:multidrug efflux system membrane fusion protein
MKRGHTRFATICGSLAIVAVAGCGPRHAAAPAADESAAMPVAIVQALPAGSDALILPARVAAREEVVVTARVPGRLTALAFREGDRFRRGQSLASFDAPEAREALVSARASLAAATMRNAQARLQEARMDSLFAARVASQRERELAQADRLASEADLAAARAGLAEITSGLLITAPFDGVVARRLADPGVTVGPGQPLLAIRSRDVGDIVAAIPESVLPRLSSTRCSFQAADGVWRDAVLVRVDGMTDFATRTRLARFRPGSPAVALEAGAFLRLRITGRASARAGGDTASRSDILSVPTRSLVQRGALAGVYVVRDGRAYLRWLRLGLADGERVRVLSGLDAADVIVADPAGLWDGRAVRVAP